MNGCRGCGYFAVGLEGTLPIKLSVEEALLSVLPLYQKSKKHGQPTFLSKAACSA